MPQLQVLNREQDPNAERLSKVGDSVTDTLLRKQALAISKMQAETQSKFATNEITKMQAGKKKLAIDSFIKLSELKDKGFSESAISQQFKMLLSALGDGDLNAGMSMFGEVSSDVDTVLQGMMKMEENTATPGQLRGAQVNKLTAEADTLKQSPTDKATYIKNIISSLQGASGKGIPPGTALNYDLGDNNKLNIPLNPVMSEEASRAARNALVVGKAGKEVAARIAGLKGRLHVGSKALVDMGQPFFTGSDLDPVVQRMNTLRSILIYIFSGQQTNEKERVKLERLMQFTGKDDAQIQEDIQEAASWMRTQLELMAGGQNKLKELLGNGSNPAASAEDMSTLSDEELEALANGEE